MVSAMNPSPGICHPLAGGHTNGKLVMTTDYLSPQEKRRRTLHNVRVSLHDLIVVRNSMPPACPRRELVEGLIRRLKSEEVRLLAGLPRYE